MSEAEETNWDGTERRNICFLHQDTIRRIEATLITLNESILGLQSFRSRAEAIGLIAALIFAASFVYTYIHKQEAMIEFQSVTARLTSVERDLSDIKGDYKALLVEMRGLKAENERTNRRLEQLIVILNKDIQHNPQGM